MSWTRHRIGPRAAIRFEAGYEDAERQVFLRTRDISEQAVFLLAPDPPPVGAAARVVLELPGQHEILRLRGWVTRREAGPESGFVVVFDHQDHERGESDGRKALRRFVNNTEHSVGEPASS
jgi:hypothetical protein